MVELPELLLPDAAAWRAWLAANHATSPGVRLVLHKKGGTVTALDYAQALDEALCFGWIDGVVGRRDDGSYLQRFTPRTRTSKWSQNNVDNIARLTAAGRVMPAGQAAVDAARADGRWEAAYAGQADARLPQDLADAVAANPRAQAMFDVLTAVNRYALIYRTTTVKTPAARAAKIARFVDMLAAGQTPYPQKRRPGS
ncbi:YdeI/OmpD-associated family protein [Specibacter sp. RAF43]|uniref:YdeI/OmpD-associated family protein n=1 Tax=Specibacter sp. RAF43 TaxID=3233057 RepID=UPI003F958DE3